MSYLTFKRDYLPGLKTAMVSVYSAKHGNYLGRIQWYGPWRQYAFYPADQTIWNPDCLEEINAEIRDLMKKRKEEKSRG